MLFSLVEAGHHNMVGLISAAPKQAQVGTR
jgi:hypothetical protein